VTRTATETQHSSARIAIIIPALNEGLSIVENLQSIRSHLTELQHCEVSLIVVDDGSSDNTAEQVLSCRQYDPHVFLLCLNRHFGKEAAISAGLRAVTDFDAAIVMDSDLQHPPELLPEMIAQWRKGNLVVEAVKSSRGSESAVKGGLVKLYYRLFNYLTRINISGDTDYKLLDREVVLAVNALPESGRFFRGLIKWMGYSTIAIPFDVPASTRQTSSWGGAALFKYALASITSFTAFPLQLVSLMGVLTFFISVVFGVMALSDKLSGQAVDGFTTVILLLLIIGSVLMFSVGLIGAYIGRIYDEVKRRPNFVTDRKRSVLPEGDK
jgi:dolichol-phosphate mannosyltransferase